ncbi:MAG: hypothetical protein ACTSQJ_17600 [Promethearchaeota archaeon]
MGKDPREKALKFLNRADRLYEADMFKKAGKVYSQAAEMYLQIHEFDTAKECYYDAAKSFINADKYDAFLDALRNAGDAALYADDFQEAYQFFKNAVKYVSEIKNPLEQDRYNILFASLSYLCLFIEGKQELGLTFLKNIKKK